MKVESNKLFPYHLIDKIWQSGQFQNLEVNTGT